MEVLKDGLKYDITLSNSKTMRRKCIPIFAVLSFIKTHSREV